MEKNKSSLIIKIITTVTFSAMVIANALANALPINGLNTGEVSAAYPNLFARQAGPLQSGDSSTCCWQDIHCTLES
ncbi:hypothetical protein [Methanohalophilus sp. RSK]|uniref:hypothetical protein n=1 Tax=Methanohalophilus sp. RSK TaxID=2485783 RepID=UPI001F168371|nr:hypothetical protein [Methanohalophilus sp. RSK]